MSMTDALREDVKGTLRGLWKSPGFTIAALATLSLGIGATSAIFSVVKAVLLTPLPYDAPDRRVMVWSRWVSVQQTWVSSQEVFDYREHARTMTDVAFWANTSQNLTDAGEPVRLNVGLVSANTFDVLGGRPSLGRAFVTDDDRANSPPVAVLGYELWAGQFAADRTLIGRRIMLNDVPVEVIGVMPEGFRLPTDFTRDKREPTELWRPLRVGPANLNRTAHTFYAAGALAPGQTPETASAELQAITRRLTEQGVYPQQMQFTAFAVGLDEEIRGELRPAMWLLMGGVGFLLAIACVNVTNLLLARGDARVREMAVRTALGASPPRLARQLLTESIVLALAGAMLGLGCAAILLRVLTNADPTSLPALASVRVDLAVIAFTLLVAVGTTLLFGVGPALAMLHADLIESLREGSQHTSAGSRRQRLRGAARSEIRQMDASVPIASVRSMNDIVAASLATPRLTGFLLAAFAAIALALAAVGIYGLLAYVVSRRTPEIGIRMAVGADRSQVLGMVLRQGLSLASAGVVVGLIGAFALTRLMEGLLYGVRPTDPITFVLVPAVLLLVALIASFLPARRATKVSPTIALRAE